MDAFIIRINILIKIKHKVTVDGVLSKDYRPQETVNKSALATTIFANHRINSLELRTVAYFTLR